MALIENERKIAYYAKKEIVALPVARLAILVSSVLLSFSLAAKCATDSSRNLTLYIFLVLAMNRVFGLPGLAWPGKLGQRTGGMLSKGENGLIARGFSEMREISPSDSSGL